MVLDFIIYWTIIVIPFFMALAPAPMNVFMGFLIAAFLFKKVLKRERVFIHTGINKPLLFLFIITCVSLLHSINYRDSIKGGVLRLLQYIFVLFAIVDSVRDKRHINKIIISMCLGICLVFLDGVWQVLSGRDFVRGYPPVFNIGLVRVTASFIDANLLGIYLSGFSPLIYALALYYGKVKEKISLGLVSLFSLIGILLTYSRPTYLAIYIVFFFYFLIKKDKMLILLLILVTLIFPLVVPQSFKNWAKEVEYNPLRMMCNDDRIAVYRNSLRMIQAHPFIGVGTNTYMKNYKNFKESPEYRNIVTPDTMYAHNMYLHMAAEIGLVGLGIFFWLLFKLFRLMKDLYRSLPDKYLKVIALGLTACTIAFLINGLTESSFFYSRVAMIFWYNAGFCLALKNFGLLEDNRK